MHSGSAGFVLRRAALAALLVLVVSSASFFLVHLASGDLLSDFGANSDVVAAERHRLGLDRPVAAQYAAWLGRAIRLDFGESLKYRRPVRQLILERAGNTLLLGAAALLLATIAGFGMGMLTGSRRGPLPATLRALSFGLLSVPPLVTSFALLLFAAATGWFPVGGAGPASFDAGPLESLAVRARYVLLPALALSLPVAASLERLQSRALADALTDRSLLAARARGIPAERLLWKHALRLSLPPVVAVYGAIVGAVLSGSFAVEVVMAWPGLGALMYEALVARDLFLVAGCAAAGSMFLAVGVFLSDVALAALDPRVQEAA